MDGPLVTMMIKAIAPHPILRGKVSDRTPKQENLVCTVNNDDLV